MKLGLREAIFFVLLLSIPVGSWALVFRPQNQRNAAMLARIVAKQERLMDLNQATVTIGDLKKEIASLEEAVKFFQSKLPNAKEMDKVLREVWELAEANHLITKSIRTLQSAERPTAPELTNLYEQPIAMQLEGDFRGFYVFLQALENQSRIMRISKLTLEKTPAGEGQIKACFDMSVFFEKSDKEDACSNKTQM